MKYAKSSDECKVVIDGCVTMKNAKSLAECKVIDRWMCYNEECKYLG